ncbi:hypothetical protein ACVR0S_08845 [Streptococcus dentapri]|uniref:Uncharacterized protein n=1 Tax=Streptococcus dentapri TaxID=573564 RepID=A0ABV8D3P8_9STRE
MYEKKLINWLFNINDINSKLLLFFIGDYGVLDKNCLKDADMIFPEILIELDDKDNDIVKQLKLKLYQEIMEVNTLKSKDFIFTYLKDRLEYDFVSKKKINLEIDYSLLDTKLRLDDLYQLLYISRYNNQKNYNEEKLCEILSAYSVYFARHYQLKELSLCIIIATDYPDLFPNTFYRDSWNFLISNQTNEGYFGYKNPFISEPKTDREKLLDSFYCYYALSELKKL